MSIIVAIDGPAGAGKSTIAKACAQRLGFLRVNTGALYRAVTLKVLESELPTSEWGDTTRNLNLRFDGDRVLLDGVDVSRRLRDADVTSKVSQVSAHADVRAGLLELQRRLGRSHGSGSVLEGRDIGTVVFPDAQLKVFLTASPDERARRRHAELQALGTAPPIDELRADIRRRDHYDSTRALAPLKAADDAIEIDTTDMTPEEVVERIVDLVSRA